MTVKSRNKRKMTGSGTQIQDSHGGLFVEAKRLRKTQLALEPYDRIQVFDDVRVGIDDLWVEIIGLQTAIFVSVHFGEEVMEETAQFRALRIVALGFCNPRFDHRAEVAID